jgi:hypothetical protein
MANEDNMEHSEVVNMAKIANVGGEPPPPPVVDYLTICCRRRLGRTTNHFV